MYIGSMYTFGKNYMYVCMYIGSMYTFAKNYNMYVYWQYVHIR